MESYALVASSEQRFNVRPSESEGSVSATFAPTPRMSAYQFHMARAHQDFFPGLSIKRMVEAAAKLINEKAPDQATRQSTLVPSQQVYQDIKRKTPPARQPPQQKRKRRNGQAPHRHLDEQGMDLFC